MAETGTDYKLDVPIEETVLYEVIEPHIATITLNRPKMGNALYSPQSELEIGKKLNMAAEDDEVKVVILRGNGPSFCSGGNAQRLPAEAFGLRPGEKPPQSKRMHGFREINENFIRTLYYSPKTVIVEAKGWVAGGGYIMAMGADLCIAGESAKFARLDQRLAFAGFDEVSFIMSFLHFGPKRARELVLTGRGMGPEEAKDWGLVNEVVPDEELKEATLRWARAVALMPTDGLMIGKVYQHMCYDMMGLGGALTGSTLAHALMQNLRWRPDEFNFMKYRNEHGTRKAVDALNERFAKLGFSRSPKPFNKD